MKKLIALAMAFICLIGLAGCNGIGQGTQEKASATYSFSGENDFFEISDGAIVLDKDKNVFRGGKLKIIQNEASSKVAAFTVTFYTMRDNEKRAIRTDSAIFNTDIVTPPDIDGYVLAEESGKYPLFGNKVESIDDLIQDFWAELKVVDLEGKESAYQLQLTVTEDVS